MLPYAASVLGSRTLELLGVIMLFVAELWPLSALLLEVLGLLGRGKVRAGA